MSAGTADEHPPDWIRYLTRPVLEELFGETTVRRGAMYQRNRAVRSLRSRPDGASMMATVQGSRHRQYTTLVATEPLGQDATLGDGTDLEVISDCSCPMGDSCKHVVAVILEARPGSV